MTGRTHDLAAFTALAAVVAVYPPASLTLSTLLLALLANQIGGVVPDVDQPTAPFWRNLPIGNVFGKVFGRLSGGHRFLTHSILGLILFGLAVRAFLSVLQPILGQTDLGIVWWAFMIGMVSHLVLDSFTKEGIPLLLPLPISFGIPPIRRLRMVTGKKLEKLIVFPGLILLAVIIFGLYTPAFLDLLHNINK